MARKKNPLRGDELLLVQSLRKNINGKRGMSLREISIVYPEFTMPRLRATFETNYSMCRRNTVTKERVGYAKVYCPEEVIEERQRALTEPMSAGARLLGDPPPSRSALARRVTA